jgi:hypothetical protein
MSYKDIYLSYIWGVRKKNCTNCIYKFYTNDDYIKQLFNG